MFSSLASFIFGSNTSATTNSEVNQHPREERQEHNRLTEENLDAENTILVTSTTPSVTGSQSDCISGRSSQAGKVNKGKRNKKNRNKRGQKSPYLITKLLTPNESCDESLDEDDWFIVEKEDEDDSLPRTDSEEELSVVEARNSSVATNAPVQAELHRQHINLHSSYNSPRLEQQRLQRSRNIARSGASPSVATLSPYRGLYNYGSAWAAKTNCPMHGKHAKQGMQGMQSVNLSTIVPSEACSSSDTSACNDSNSNMCMEESWFVTPPPCFTKNVPVNMATSPYENLLIEHPSMSVYHSIRSAQEAAESFINLDLGVRESRENRRPIAAAAAVSATVAVESPTTGKNVPPATAQQSQPRHSSARTDRLSAAQLKQELFARSIQKSHDKKERQNLCRGAMKRSNKVRDFQSKANRQRRSDMQHCKILSGANNNRKCCF